MSENTVKVVVGTTLKDQLRDVADAWGRAGRGEEVHHQVVASRAGTRCGRC